MVIAHHHDKFGLATYVKNDLLPLVQILPSTSSFYIAIKINDITINNVYKPPSAEFDDALFPSFEKSSVVIDDFNSHNTLWGYDDNDRDGIKLFNTTQTIQVHSIQQGGTDHIHLIFVLFPKMQMDKRYLLLVKSWEAFQTVNIVPSLCKSGCNCQ